MTDQDAGSIVVTGIRKSLQSAQNLKRNSNQIVDAIVAEDIGKLPDIAVSDTAARIPGVQVERGGGEAGRVLVRGLPDFTTTFNGREIFTAETRQVALQDFPAGAIAAVEVFKTSSANLVEAGLAGLINVRSRRPFDFKGREIAGSLWGVYPNVSRDFAPNGQLLLSDRWKAGDGEFGALINFSYTKLHYRDSTRRNTDFVAPGPNGSRFPDIQRVTYGEGVRSRPSINGALQWRPQPGLEFYVDGLWQGFRNKLSDRELSVPLWGGQQYNNLTFRDGTNLLTGGTVVNPFRPDGYQGGTYNKTNTYQFAVGGSWDSGPLKVSADLARTTSRFTGSTESVDFAFANPQTIDFITNVPGSDGPSFTIRNFDPANPANYVYRGLYEQAQVAKGKDVQARLDAEYETGIDAISKIEAGVRYVNRDADRQFGDRYSTQNGGSALSTVPLEYELFAPGFRGDDMKPFPSTWLAPTYDSIRSNIEQLRTYAGYPSGAPPYNPREAVFAKEKSTAAYAQLSYKFGLVDGQVGLRYVRTHDNLRGNQLFFGPDPDGAGPLPPPAGVFREADVDRSYSDWLPNASARFKFTDKLQLRLAATKTRTRPNFRDLSPSSTIDQVPACFSQTPVQPGCTLTGGGGNPFLERLKSNNYDASLEYYFGRTSFASVAAFRRDMTGFIEGGTTDVIEPISGRPLRLGGPINSGKGKIQGAEAQFTTFLDFGGTPDWLHAFGVQANVTYIDAKADFAQGIGSPPAVVTRRLLGVSKWTYNLAAFYEKNGFNFRMSYNYRTPWMTSYQPRNDFSSGGQPYLFETKTLGVGRLDLSTSYNIKDNITLFYDWTNILKRPYRAELIRTQGNLVEQFPLDVRFEESVMSGGIRFKF
ncbi:TonB-dependent receptor [Sphingomonas sp. RB1R13]|uniref:TonB-dependent receptor n=1 Tax=Sphingomonas sp. RB1R13 TaxID=3096159 RepID=UPI002FCBE1F6